MVMPIKMDFHHYQVVYQDLQMQIYKNNIIQQQQTIHL